MKLNSLTIKTRIIVTLALLAISMVTVGTLGLFGMQGVLADLNEMYEHRVLVVGDLGDLQSSELQRQVKESGGDFIPAHASGHIYMSDLRELVTTLNPKTVIPIHTFEPEMFRDYFPNTVLLMDGQDHVV